MLQPYVSTFDPRRLWAYSFRPNLSNAMLDGWTVYNPVAEFKRMGVPNAFYTLTELNKGFQTCVTYPEVLAVPTGVSLAELKESAAFRSKHRLPVLTWTTTQPCWRGEQKGSVM